jgi:NDP-sugar pyrophosphorylase family protein
MNGDLVTQADIGAMLDTHAALGPRATVAVRRYFHTVPFGCVETEGTRIVRIEEKPQLVRLINAGIYVLDPGILDCVVKNQALLITSLLEDCLARGERVQAFEVEEDWIDVGQRDQLRRAAGREA